MALVDGERFDRHVRPREEDALDEAGLRAVLPQLVAAVQAIHDARSGPRP